MPYTARNYTPCGTAFVLAASNDGARVLSPVTRTRLQVHNWDMHPACMGAHLYRRTVTTYYPKMVHAVASYGRKAFKKASPSRSRHPCKTPQDITRGTQVGRKCRVRGICVLMQSAKKGACIEAHGVVESLALRKYEGNMWPAEEAIQWINEILTYTQREFGPIGKVAGFTRSKIYAVMLAQLSLASIEALGRMTQSEELQGTRIDSFKLNELVVTVHIIPIGATVDECHAHALDRFQKLTVRRDETPQSSE
ncbi:hypothetical protein FVE85_9442 [Porphyridium purpureum]|uniref:Uncharacterized protein n=1 Tax=Porphyridium purpureum TaxID=35688 RepID=A0A5J4YL32_PORPP|nr:hypothetical protein FVE85_9442 [Porphyridium purpureum]|eukprot:POR6674..scf261_15